MTRAAIRSEPSVPAIAPSVAEQAVAADEQRIAIELVDTVIRDLFGVGLTLYSALPHISGPAEQPVTAAIDGIDRIIRTIRDVVFRLAPADGHRVSTSPGRKPDRCARDQTLGGGDSRHLHSQTARMRPDDDDTNGDPVEALHDTEAESGDEEGLQDMFDMDEREARELGVALDSVAPTEPELD